MANPPKLVTGSRNIVCNYAHTTRAKTGRFTKNDNPNHDPKTGEFSSGFGGDPGGVFQLDDAPKNTPPVPASAWSPMGRRFHKSEEKKMHELFGSSKQPKVAHDAAGLNLIGPKGKEVKFEPIKHKGVAAKIKSKLKGVGKMAYEGVKYDMLKMGLAGAAKYVAGASIAEAGLHAAKSFVGLSQQKQEKPNMKTGSRRIVCNASPQEQEDPVGKAKMVSDHATQAATEATEAQERAQQTQDATQKRDEANNRSKVAFQQKSGKKCVMAHQTAAMAHEDAQKAFTKLAGETSGYDLESRANAKKMADEHGAFAERHGMMAEGKPDPANIYGKYLSKNSIQTSLRDVVVKTNLDAGTGGDVGAAAPGYPGNAPGKTSTLTGAKCPKCGASNKAGSATCTACGKKL